jgi:hypothetical protein
MYDEYDEVILFFTGTFFYFVSSQKNLSDNYKYICIEGHFLSDFKDWKEFKDRIIHFYKIYRLKMIRKMLFYQLSFVYFCAGY